MQSMLALHSKHHGIGNAQFLDRDVSSGVPPISNRIARSAGHFSKAIELFIHRAGCCKFRHKKHLSNLHRIAVNFRCRFSRSSKILSGQRGPFGDVRSASSDSGLGPSLPFMIEPSGERKNQNFMSCISCQSKRRLFLNSTTFV